VVNAGLAGAAIGGVLDRLEVAIAAYHPDLYVYGFTPNDIEGPEYRLLEPDAARRAWIARANAQPLLLFRWLAWQLATVDTARSPAEQPYARELRRNYFENEAAWQRFAAGLDRFAGLARQRQVCAVVLIHTHLTDLDADHPFLPVYARVEAAARERGLAVAGSFDAFAGRAPQSLWINPLDSHPNAEGHALLAGVLARELLALPERCLEPKRQRGRRR
jgi:lysophospholipase L1-like esterase